MFILISRCDITRQSRSARLRPQATECLISNEYFSGHKLQDLKGWDVIGSDQLIYTSLHWTVVEPLMNAGSFASVFFCVVKHLLARCIHANLINIRKGQKSVTELFRLRWSVWKCSGSDPIHSSVLTASDQVYVRYFTEDVSLLAESECGSLTRGFYRSDLQVNSHTGAAVENITLLSSRQSIL